MSNSCIIKCLSNGVSLSRFIVTNRISSRCISGITKKIETDILDESKIGIIRLKDPKKLNALTIEMGEEFLRAVDMLENEATNQRIRFVMKYFYSINKLNEVEVSFNA